MTRSDEQIGRMTFTQLVAKVWNDAPLNTKVMFVLWEGFLAVGVLYLLFGDRSDINVGAWIFGIIAGTWLGIRILDEAGSRRIENEARRAAYEAAEKPTPFAQIIELLPKLTKAERKKLLGMLRPAQPRG
jgi:hypothetical protein